MAPTKATVPAKLHAELTEYTTLLRSIRINSTLDLVSKVGRPLGGEEESDHPESDEDGESERSQTRTEDLPDLKGKVKATRYQKFKATDTWTRWPLLLEHCPIPEWGFDEEVRAIAEQTERACASVANGDEDLTLLPAYHTGSTSDAARKLSRLLSLLALHRAGMTYTKHGRVDPMGWQDVLEVVSATGLFSQSIVADVKTRMEKILGPSEFNVVHNMQVLHASKQALLAAEAEFGVDPLILMRPPPRPSQKKSADKTHVQ